MNLDRIKSAMFMVPNGNGGGPQGMVNSAFQVNNNGNNDYGMLVDSNNGML